MTFLILKAQQEMVSRSARRDHLQPQTKRRGQRLHHFTVEELWQELQPHTTFVTLSHIKLPPPVLKTQLWLEVFYCLQTTPYATWHRLEDVVAMETGSRRSRSGNLKS